MGGWDGWDRPVLPDHLPGARTLLHSGHHPGALLPLNGAAEDSGTLHRAPKGRAKPTAPEGTTATKRRRPGGLAKRVDPGLCATEDATAAAAASRGRRDTKRPHRGG